MSAYYPTTVRLLEGLLELVPERRVEALIFRYFAKSRHREKLPLTPKMPCIPPPNASSYETPPFRAVVSVSRIFAKLGAALDNMWGFNNNVAPYSYTTLLQFYSTQFIQYCIYGV